MRDEDGIHFLEKFWLGAACWSSRRDSRTWHFVTRAYAEKIASVLDARIPGRGYSRGPVQVRGIFLMTDNPKRPAEILIGLAHQFKNRIDGLQLKGKRRDNAALEFFLGAASALFCVGKDKEANVVLRCAALLIATRGYSEVECWATWPVSSEPKP